MNFLALVLAGCSMFESRPFQPKPWDNMRQIAASDATRVLDGEVSAFLRDKYTIVSARHFQVAADTSWISVSKFVQNEMAAKSFKPVMFDWYEPGLDTIDVYPQGKSGFAVAQPKETRPTEEKLIGFYVLKAR